MSALLHIVALSGLWTLLVLGAVVGLFVLVEATRSTRCSPTRAGGAPVRARRHRRIGFVAGAHRRSVQALGEAERPRDERWALAPHRGEQGSSAPRPPRAGPSSARRRASGERSFSQRVRKRGSPARRARPGRAREWHRPRSTRARNRLNLRSDRPAGSAMQPGRRGRPQEPVHHRHPRRRITPAVPQRPAPSSAVWPAR